MTYKYLCKKCGTKKELEYPMGSAPKVMVCPCGGSMEQDFLGKLKSIQTDLPEDYKELKKIVEYITKFYCDLTATELIVPTNKTYKLFKEKYPHVSIVFGTHKIDEVNL